VLLVKQARLATMGVREHQDPLVTLDLLVRLVLLVLQELQVHPPTRLKENEEQKALQELRERLVMLVLLEEMERMEVQDLLAQLDLKVPKEKMGIGAIMARQEMQANLDLMPSIVHVLVAAVLELCRDHTADVILINRFKFYSIFVVWILGV